jgi:uncharacterized repeat protein (TIGR02543 family)
MKKARLIWKILGPALTLTLFFAGCEVGGSEDVNRKGYTVSYSVGIGSGTPPSSQIVREGNSITLPGQGAMRAPSSGGTFDGWLLYEQTYSGGNDYFDSASPNGDGYQEESLYPAGSQYRVYNSVLFTAQWTNVVSGDNPFVGEWTGQMSGSTGNVSVSVSITSDSWTITTGSDKVSGANGSYTYTGSSAIFSDNYGGQVGTAYLSDDTLGLQMTGGAYSGMSGVFTKSSTSGQYTVTFNASGGSVSQSSISVNAGATVTNLPTPTRTGYTFGGWFTQTNGGGTQFTATTAVNGNITVYAKWTTAMAEGVYIGIISFAGDATDLTGGTPVLLDYSGKNSLTNRIDTQYNISTQGGTALFYGVHRALANLTNMTAYPDKLDSVNVITFTDGLDNGSTGRSLLNSIEEQTFDTENEYATYVKSQIDSRSINGKPITAYSVGVRGGDVTDILLFQSNLEKIASNGKSHELTDFSSLQTTFDDIAANLLTVNSSTSFNMITTLLSSGAKVRMTFDVTGTNPSDAAASSKYIEGTITRTGAGTNLTYTFGSITYGGGLGSTQGAGPITGSISGSEVTFSFTGMSGYVPDTDRSKARQWTMTSGATEWQINSEYSVGGGTNTQVDKRSAIIYLVLDSSTSLSPGQDGQIGQIRTAVKQFITSIYNRVNGISN